MLLQLLWNGLVAGALYGLVAVGYTLVFGIIRVVFFAQGELSMVAAFMGLAVFTAFGGSTEPTLWVVGVASVAGIVASVTGGLLAERICLRPIKSAPAVKSLITSLGASIVLQNVVLLTVGAHPIPFPVISTSQIDVLGTRFGVFEITTVVVFFVVVSIIHLFLQHHRFGLAIRAVAQSREGARLMGISPDKAIVATFVLAGVTAGIAGLFMASYTGVIRFNMGFVPGIKGFTVAILGGIGNVRGAAAAALLLGVTEALFAGFISSTYRDLVVFLVLVTVLALRPRGLLRGEP